MRKKWKQAFYWHDNYTNCPNVPWPTSIQAWQHQASDCVLFQKSHVSHLRDSGDCHTARLSVADVIVRKNLESSKRYVSVFLDAARTLLMLVVAHLNNCCICNLVNRLFSFLLSFLFFTITFNFRPHIAIPKLLLYVYFTYPYSLVHEFSTLCS